MMGKEDPDLEESMIADKAQGLNDKKLVVRLSDDGLDQLKESMFQLRTQVGILAGIQSLVLRCAFRFRIRHPECFQGESQKR